MDHWEIRFSREEVQHKGDRARTYGSYAVYSNGIAVDGLEGFVCESPGPSDNGDSGIRHHRRIEAGTYDLSTHFGNYVSTGFPSEPVHADGKMPGFQLLDTGKRTNILIHPGHPPTLYLSSIGCLNLTGAIGAAEDMNFQDSWTRVVSVIASLRQFCADAFKTPNNTKIPNATAVVVGEPE